MKRSKPVASFVILASSIRHPLNLAAHYLSNTLDLSAVVAVQEMTHLPIIVDPSHGTGRRSMIAPMSRAAIAAGADGLIIEVHPHPEQALSDGDQSLRPEQFAALMEEARRIAEVMGRKI